MDLIMDGNPDIMIEFDLAWAQIAGNNPMDWVKKYDDRIVSAHIKDIAAPGECQDEDGWADVGHGVMDWPSLMAALKAAGTKYFIMEHDNPSDHARFAQRSIETAKAL
jgi:sugar phosphate isomerase/epimerase